MPCHAPRPVVAVAAVAVLLAGCTPPASDEGEVIITTDERIPEIRAARQALAEPVPAVTAEAARLVDALEEVWTREAAADDRAEFAEALRLDPFRDALGDLDAVVLEGDGPDVTAAAEVVDAMVADGRGLLAVAEEELASLTSVPSFDTRLEDVVAQWDQRGSYSQQLQAFEQFALDAEALAEEAAGRTGTPACVELWPRREEAARVVAERSRELRASIRDRRGQEFDELRDAYRQDPYGLGALLGVMDAQAAAACWAEESDAPPVLDLLDERTEEIAEALDPQDLQG